MLKSKIKTITWINRFDEMVNNIVYVFYRDKSLLSSSIL